MSDAVRLWVEAAYNPALRCGGWAFVAAAGETRAGSAGGERTPSGERIALAGLLAALKAAPGDAELTIHSASPQVLAAPRRLAAFEAGDETPAGDLDLWAGLATAMKGRRARFAAAANAPQTPTSFATAWAELARDKAKAAGAFTAAIPKPNLAKARI